MNYQPAKLKVTEQGFNNMPAQENIIDALSQMGEIEFVDVPEKSYWQNEDDTVVVKIKNNGSGIAVASRIVKLLRSINPDEVDTIILDDARVIMRLWWD